MNMLSRNTKLILAAVGMLMASGLHAQPPANKPVVGASAPGPSQTIAPAPSGYIINGQNPMINYVRTREAKSRITDESVFASATSTNVQQVTSYIDGLGRPLQTVKQQVSPGSNPEDMVSPVFYDPLGRETYKYLPYTETSGTSTTDGKFKLTPFTDQAAFYQGVYVTDQPSLSGEQTFYEQTNYESSPQNRVLEKMGAGNSWAGSGRGSNFQYLYTGATDAVQYWTITNNPLSYDNNGNADPSTNTNIPATSVTYNAGQLIKNVTLDEAGNATVSYIDKENHVVLKKVQQGVIPADFSGYTNWLCTYYVYDDLDNLRFVIPPNVVQTLVTAGNWNLSANTTIINELCYRYEYDDHKRMIAKKIPGAGWGYMIYDQRDRVVFSQDANMRGNTQWLTLLYDGLDRLVMKAMMSSTVQEPGLQSYVTTATEPAAAGTASSLTLSSPSVGTYQATGSITMIPGFSATGTSGTFVAQIVPTGGTSSPSTIIDGVAVNNNPLPQGTAITPLIINYYDDYTWTSKSFTSAYNSSVNAGTNPFAEALPSNASAHTRGLQTGKQVRVIENPGNLSQGSMLSTADFFNDRGIQIQENEDNYRGGTDIFTHLYDFQNKLLSSYKVYNNPNAGVAGTVHILNYINYDPAGRPLQEYETINDNSATTRLLAQMSYDNLGKPKQKQLGQKSDGTFLETQNMSYNIRGWLQGINRDYANNDNSRGADTRWFGIELDYDWGFGTNQYTGNIAGTRWRSNGDGQQRAYGYTYDAVNRLMSGDFSQYDGTASAYTDNSVINFDMVMGNGTDPTTAYDPNGNILHMKQWGLKNNANALIDDLTYTYNTGSNKLQNVIDAQNDPTTTLGDFRTSSLSPYSTGKTTAAVDYYYDNNGNLTRDLNKDIGTQAANGIAYNYLGLPYQVTVQAASGTKGTITYVYDADGRKLKKNIVDNPGQMQTTIIYLDELNYQVRQQTNGTGSLVDTLQFILNLEGRVRPAPNSPSTQAISSFNYDYFVKDHLGDTRMVLTDEQTQDIYPAATLENNNTPATDPVTVEEQYYTVNTSQIVSNPSGIPTYQNNNGNPPVNNNPNCSNTSPIKQTDNSQKVYLMNVSSTPKTGLGITLKVMSGDRLDIFGLSYYTQSNTGGQPANVSMAALDIINGLLSAPGSLAGERITSSQLTANTTGDITPLSNFISSHDNPNAETIPRAYLNYVFFDDQFNFAGSGASQVGQPNVLTNHYTVNQQLNDIIAPKNGYVYVFCSNESPVNVYFDNLQVILTHGPLVEETHYYPYGLTMAGISDQALIAGYTENKYRFNGGNELQHKEFSDGSGLELYSSDFRSLDPQLGRWWQIDPKPDFSQSLYAAMNDDPALASDPHGDTVIGNKQAIDNYKNTLKKGKQNSQDKADAAKAKLQSLEGKKGLFNNIARGLAKASLASATRDLKGFDKAIAEFGSLESSKQVYNVQTNVNNLTSNEQGKTSYDSKTGYINVFVGDNATNPLGTLAHELTHAFQYENGETDMRYNGKGSANAADLTDELAAFQRGQLVDPTYYPGTTFTLQMLQSSYPDDKPEAMDRSTPFGISTYGQSLNEELYRRGSSGLDPDVIMIGWQVPYALGVLSRIGF